MLNREFGRTGELVSVLGFGCMRLPVSEAKYGIIDHRLAKHMLRCAIDRGVNYIDAMYEPVVAQALSEGYRERVLLATRLPVGPVKSRADMDVILNTQLESLRTDHVDCYLLHAINMKAWTRLRQFRVIDFLDSALADGRIRYAGFSFHGDSAEFKPIVDAYDWAFCQIQYNYMDTEFQAGTAGLRYAAKRGIGVIVMEPLKGGSLVSRVPEAVQSVWDSASVKRTPAEWALRFVWNEPGVSLLLSGMNTVEEVVENVRVAEGGMPHSLAPEELELISRVRDVYKTRTLVNCTACNYCLPCPSGVNIPIVFSCLNDCSLYDDHAGARFRYWCNYRWRPPRELQRALSAASARKRAAGHRCDRRAGGSRASA